MNNYIQHLQNYSKPLGLGSLSNGDDLAPSDMTDAEFEINVLEWVLEIPGTDLYETIFNRINELK